MANAVISRDDALVFGVSKESSSVEKIPAAPLPRTNTLSGVGNAADHYAVSDREIKSTFNASAGLNGYRPAVAASYSRFDTDGQGNSLSLAAGAKATLGEGVELGFSAVKRWTHKLDDGNRVDVSAGAGMEFSTQNGMNSSAGLRADYVRKDGGLSPYFTAIASTQDDKNLTLGVGACKDVQIAALPQATLCAGAELREERPGVAFSIGRNF
jgi:hypothetical protein